MTEAKKEEKKSEIIKTLQAQIANRGKRLTKRSWLRSCRESGRCSNNSTSQFAMVFSPSHSPGSCLLFFKGNCLSPQHPTKSCSYRVPIQTCPAPPNHCMGDGWSEGGLYMLKVGEALGCRGGGGNVDGLECG